MGVQITSMAAKGQWCVKVAGIEMGKEPWSSSKQGGETRSNLVNQSLLYKRRKSRIPLPPSPQTVQEALEAGRHEP
jgi:hypothetical protein